ncbi:hypothetical protein N7523_007220 [Penicillium sp. IBT 18751x]|nr:hypothetical protein N7523_007220 [Penicillium sp. IBT 18751x]
MEDPETDITRTIRLVASFASSASSTYATMLLPDSPWVVRTPAELSKLSVPTTPFQAGRHLKNFASI